MCLTIPGKVVSVSDDFVIVDYGTTKRKARLKFVKPNKGEYVLVQQKFVVEIVPEKKAKEILKEWEEAFDS